MAECISRALAKGRALGALAACAAVIPAPAPAHTDLANGQPLWTAWHLSPELSVGTALLAVIYVKGWRRELARPKCIGRRLTYFLGLTALFLAVQSPLDALSGHLFAAHQVEHMLLRAVAPMLLVIAQPQGTLSRGLTATLGHDAVKHLLRSAALRRTFGVLGRPAVAVLLFVGAHGFWMLPTYHDEAVLNPLVHETWHASLLLTGLLFWSRVLDPRRCPPATRFGARIAMVWCGVLANVALGAFLAFKDTTAYAAYDHLSPLWNPSALADEQQGALILWIPGSMMLVLGAVLVLRLWAREEERAVRRTRSRQGAVCRTASDQPFSGSTFAPTSRSVRQPLHNRFNRAAKGACQP